MLTKKHPPYTAFKLWLAGHGITYKDVGKAIDCSETTVMQKINGYSDFYISEQIAICEAFGCEYNIFFTQEIA